MALKEAGIIAAGAVAAVAIGFGGIQAGRAMESGSRDVPASAAPTATPKPSEAAGSPLPKPSKTPDAGGATSSSSGSSSSTFRDYELKPGESTTVTGYALVQGDVIVDGKRLYDEDPKTGLIVEIDGGTHRIDAPYGGDVMVFGTEVNKTIFDSTQGHIIGLMKEKGCDPKPKPGCDSVNVVKIGPVKSK